MENTIKELDFVFGRKYIYSLYDWTKKEALWVIKRARKFQVKTNYKYCEGKVMASIFGENSSRTSGSTDIAMHRLGGKVENYAVEKSSITKGETITDTLNTVSRLVDIISIRLKTKGFGRVAENNNFVPIISGGDGNNQHVTQALGFAKTVYDSLGTLENLHVGWVGDLRYGRVPHSEMQLMSLFNPAAFYFISPRGLMIPRSYINQCVERGIKYHETENMTKYISRLDVMVITRMQKERFVDPIEREKYMGYYTVNLYILNSSKAKKNLIISHPLPRNFELSPDIDGTPYDKYHAEMDNCYLVRCALITALLEVDI